MSFAGYVRGNSRRIFWKDVLAIGDLPPAPQEAP